MITHWNIQCRNRPCFLSICSHDWQRLEVWRENRRCQDKTRQNVPCLVVTCALCLPPRHSVFRVQTMIHSVWFGMWPPYTDYAIPVHCPAVFSELCRSDVFCVLVWQCRIEIQRCGVKVVVVRSLGLRILGCGL